MLSARAVPLGSSAFARPSDSLAFIYADSLASHLEFVRISRGQHVSPTNNLSF